MAKDAAFPDYADPPVSEVVMGMQFASLEQFTTAHVGSYWGIIREDFPQVEEQPPIGHMVEGPPAKEGEGAVNLWFAAKPPLLRTWFIDAGGRCLIQVQRDRFLYNWRKREAADAYIRYPAIKESFFRYWQGFEDFLGKSGLPRPSVDQCEITYVNRVDQNSGWNSFGDLHRVFRGFLWKPRVPFLPEPETMSWSLSFRLPEDAGRLHAEAAPVRVQPQNALAMRFTLTARGLPKSLDDRGLKAWFDLGHEWIVKGFVDLVSEETDKLWQRR